MTGSDVLDLKERVWKEIVVLFPFRSYVMRAINFSYYPWKRNWPCINIDTVSVQQSATN